MLYIMSWTCKYKHSLGVPGKGVHTHYMGIAYKDVLGTLAIAIILHFIFPKVSIWLLIILLFLLGIVLHRIFCVPTTIDKYIFGTKE